MAFSITSAKKDGVVLVEAVGELDMATAEELWCHLFGWFQQGEQQILIDCAEVSFLDCAGIGVLVRCHKVVSRVGGRIGLRYVNSMVRIPLTITGLADVFLDEDEIPEVLLGRPLSGAPSSRDLR